MAGLTLADTRKQKDIKKDPYLGAFFNSSLSSHSIRLASVRPVSIAYC